MKIIQICGSYAWGGLEMQSYIISKGLANQGNKVILICPTDSILATNALVENLTIASLDYCQNFIRVVKSFKRIFTQFVPDVIHCQLSKDLQFVVPAIRHISPKIPLVFTKRMASNIHKNDIFHHYLYNRINKVFAISHYIRENLIKTTPVKKNNIEVLYNGVDFNIFNPELFSKNTERKKFEIESDTLLIGVAGRVSPLKGHKEFIDAAKIIHDIIPQKHTFIVIGGASYSENAFYEEIKEYALTHANDVRIIFTGHSSEMARHLSMLDILIFPSHEESLGNVVLEAMAMGIPVVASNSGGVPEIVKHNKTGILVKPKDSQSIALGVLNLIQNPAKMKKIRENAFQYIRENNDITNYISRLSTIYKSLKDSGRLAMFHP